jgi:hypothetical protein
VLLPVHQQLADRVGRDLLESIYSATRSSQKQSEAAGALPVAVR